MRILVVGAGAVGGYFGGRLLAAGRDVVFLVRENRAAQLARTGLSIRSPLGDVNLASPPTATAGTLREPFDLILLGCKAYDLAAAADAFAPAAGAQTAILPLLNGMAHLDFLATRFGRGRVLGGLCVISSTLDAEGHILHLNDAHRLVFGELDNPDSARADAIAATLSGAGFDSRLSRTIRQELWDKWVFFTTPCKVNRLATGSYP
jgi:2-dehydropantoate 2-reductase